VLTSDFGALKADSTRKLKSSIDMGLAMVVVGDIARPGVGDGKRADAPDFIFSAPWFFDTLLVPL